MIYSRVEKFKNYRESIIKEEAQTFSTPNEVINHKATIDTLGATTTLPLGEVMEKANETHIDKKFKINRIKRILKFCLMIVAFVVIILIIVIIGIGVFGE